MKTTKPFNKNLVILMIALFSGFLSLTKAQDRYSFATWDKFNDVSKTYYLVISDPVKNWYDLNKDKQEDWEISFRTSANQQAGKEMMKNFDKPIPVFGDWKRFSSLAQCKEGIQTEINRFKKLWSGFNVEVIYINLYEY